jgi:ribosomal-protein-alanine N-acetyltransferase
MEVGHYSVVLEEAEIIVGFAIYSPIIPESHLLNIAIDPAHQGKGFGEQLLDQVIFQNKTIGVKIISLEVRASNETAINLYEKMQKNRGGSAYKNPWKVFQELITSFN